MMQIPDPPSPPFAHTPTAADVNDIEIDPFPPSPVFAMPAVPSTAVDAIFVCAWERRFGFVLVLYGPG